MSDGINIAETIGAHDSSIESPPTAPASLVFTVGLVDELDARLRGLQSFFNSRHQPLTEQERAAAHARDWKNEMSIARGAFLRGAQLVFDLIRNNSTDFFDDAARFDNLDAAPAASLANNEAMTADTIDASEASLVALADALTDAHALCEAVCQTQAVSFKTWASAGRIFTRELHRSEAFMKIAGRARHAGRARLHPRLLYLTRNIQPDALGTDVGFVFAGLLRLLDYLRLVDRELKRDHPLLQTLPVFALIHEDAHRLLKFMETRALRAEDLESEIFDTLDGTSYAVGMELRKVFAHELVALSALRQAPLIYAKVENAHGLLRDSFQQSIVGLAQTFDPTLDGAQLFDAFNAKLEQSLALRRDLWTLLGLVRRMEQERDRRPFAPLLARLQSFRQSTMRYLMYKDWEAYERFIEEASAARGAVELAPVLHRFGTYLETLFGQINMRAALAAHPFDYPPVQD